MIKLPRLAIVCTFISVGLGWGNLTRAQQRFGYLRLSANVDSSFVVVDRNFKSFHVMSKSDSLRLSAGLHKIVVASKAADDQKLEAQIAPGKTTTYSVKLRRSESHTDYMQSSAYPRLYWRSNLVILTDEDSEIFIGVKNYGRGEAKIDTTFGDFTITTRHPQAGSKRRVVAVYSNRLSIVEMYNTPIKSTAYFLTIFPGARQYYQNEKLKGAALFGLFATSAVLLYHHHALYKEKNLDYLWTRYFYRYARSEAEAERLARQAKMERGRAMHAAERRNTFAYITLGLYALNFLDGLGAPSGGYRDQRKVRARLAPFSKHDAVGLDFAMQF